MKTRGLVPSNRLFKILAGAFAAFACSLGVPSEDEVFGTQPSTSNGGSGGSSDSGDTSGGNAGTTGSSGSSSTAGSGGKNTKPEPGGDGGTPSEPPGDGGTGGDDDPKPPINNGDGGTGGDDNNDPDPVVLPPAVLEIHYTFDDLSSAQAIDSSGNELHGTLHGDELPEGEDGYLDGALSLNGMKKQYVSLPTNILEGKEAVSVAAWLKLSAAQPWDRLFDFNSSDLNWFYFSPTGWNFNTSTTGTHIAVRNAGILAPEIQLTETVSVGIWRHIAVVLAPPYLRYYLDGKLKAELTNMNLAPRDLGKTHQNWIGRSVYPADPYLSALIDDFRFYSGALTDEEVAELADM